MPGVLLFGDSIGVPRLLRILSRERICGVVRAEIRPGDADPVEALASAHSLRLLVQPRPNSSEYDRFVGSVRSIAPDLIAVDSYSMLLRNEVLAIPRLGAVNLHYALLPQYRGPNPIQWALINHERETGATLHYMTGDFDQGEIIDQRRVPITVVDTWKDVVSRIDVVAEEMLAEQLPRVLEGSATSSPQDEASASRYPRRTREDGRLDWSWSALRIHDLIRALVHPLPGAFYGVDGNEVVLGSYMTISEVIALKYGSVGGHELRDDALTLRPDTPIPTDRAFEFAAECDGRELGHCVLRTNWEARTAAVDEGGVPAHTERVRSLLARFAQDELGVELRSQ